MTGYLIALVGVVGTIIGAAVGAYLIYKFTARQNKKDKLWARMVETYCDRLLIRLGDSLYRTYLDMKQSLDEPVEELNRRYYKYDRRLENVEQQVKLSFMPAGFSSIESESRKLLTWHKRICRLIILGEIDDNDPRVRNIVQEMEGLLGDLARNIGEASDTIYQLEQKNYEHVHEMMWNDPDLNRIGLDILRIAAGLDELLSEKDWKEKLGV